MLMPSIPESDFSTTVVLAVDPMRKKSTLVPSAAVSSTVCSQA